MPNPYHFLIEPLADDVVSPFMKRDVLRLRKGTLVSPALVPDRFRTSEAYRGFVKRRIEERKEIEELDRYLLDKGGDVLTFDV